MRGVGGRERRGGVTLVIVEVVESVVKASHSDHQGVMFELPDK